MHSYWSTSTSLKFCSYTLEHSRKIEWNDFGSWTNFHCLQISNCGQNSILLIYFVEKIRTSIFIKSVFILTFIHWIWNHIWLNGLCIFLCHKELFSNKFQYIYILWTFFLLLQKEFQVKEDFVKISEFSDSHCVSIYIFWSFNQYDI